MTGAGRGIGRAIAVALAARAYDVALLGRTEAELAETAKDIEAKNQRALPICCDVSVSTEIAAAAERVARELGAPGVVVNNAGVVRRASVVSMTEADWDLVLDTNLKGPFLVARAFLPAMLANKQGRIIAIGSISGTLGTKDQSAYSASKWGLIGFTKSLAAELVGTGLQTMCVMPGSVDTLMLEGSGFAPEMTAEDVARLVVYAALDAPAQMNGSAMEMFGS